MSEDDLVRFFRSVLGDTSRDGGACIPLHPSPPAFTSASRRDRACRDLDLPKTLCRESGFFATRHRGERSPRVGNRRAGTTRAATSHGNPEGGGLTTRGRGARGGARVPGSFGRGRARARLDPLYTEF